jgi:hypothetical protein
MTDKSHLLVTLAGMPENDPRLEGVAGLLSGKAKPEQQSLRLFRIGEAAKELSMSRCSVWRLMREKRLRTVEVRKGSHRIPEAELRRFVQGV